MVKLFERLKDKNIIFVTPELKSFKVRAGGLGPAVEELAKNLGEHGLNVIVVSLLYKYMRDNKDQLVEVDYSDIPMNTVKEIDIWVSEEKVHVKVKEAKMWNTTFYFLENEKYANVMYESDMLKQAIFLAHGTLEALSALSIKPHIIHLNDGHTGLIALFLKTELSYRNGPLFKDVKTALTIHNAGKGYQQIFGIERFEELDIGEEHRDKVIWNGMLNLTYAALNLSDICNTVSPDYAETLKNDGEGLGELFRSKKIFGILNGIDTEYWRMDELKKMITKKGLRKIKEGAKRKLIEEIAKRSGVKISADRLTIVIPRRFAGQKGFDLFLPYAELICKGRKEGGMGAQFVVLGRASLRDPIGRKWIEECKSLSERLKGKFVFIYGFDEELAKLMYAGGDLLLYPSLPGKEPCGTGYMMAMVNGTPTLGTDTGGMVDVIHEFDPSTGKGNGFKIEKERYSSSTLLEKLRKASDIFYNKPEKWLQLIWNAYRTKVDIEKTAKEYVKKVYLPLLT